MVHESHPKVLQASFRSFSLRVFFFGLFLLQNGQAQAQERRYISNANWLTPKTKQRSGFLCLSLIPDQSYSNCNN